MTVEQAARDFFCWFNRHYPAPSTNPDHEWNRLGVALVNHQEDAQAAPNPGITHCGNCECDWLDNGLNPIGCPYCEHIDWRAERMTETAADENDRKEQEPKRTVTYVCPICAASMIESDEALLRQALEALEFFRDTAICEADTAVATEAIAALRERLGVKEQA